MPDLSDFIWRIWGTIIAWGVFIAYTLWFFGDPPPPAPPIRDMA